jgi:hypothetical protein
VPLTGTAGEAPWCEPASKLPGGRRRSDSNRVPEGRVAPQCALASMSSGRPARTTSPGHWKDSDLARSRSASRRSVCVGCRATLQGDRAVRTAPRVSRLSRACYLPLSGRRSPSTTGASAGIESEDGVAGSISPSWRCTRGMLGAFHGPGRVCATVRAFARVHAQVM